MFKEGDPPERVLQGEIERIGLPGTCFRVESLDPPRVTPTRKRRRAHLFDGPQTRRRHQARRRSMATPHHRASHFANA